MTVLEIASLALVALLLFAVLALLDSSHGPSVASALRDAIGVPIWAVQLLLGAMLYITQAERYHYKPAHRLS
jgi:hypothetical protein